MIKSRGLTFLIAATALSIPASADILFIDINDAPQEIAAARRAAEARGEKLIVIPREGDRTQISEAVLRRGMMDLKSRGVKLSSVVISGHDGNGVFSGTRGTQSASMSADQLSNALSSAPEVTKDVRSLLLWGCRTTSLGSIEVHWRNVFPNVGVYAGFDGSGPSKIRDANHRFLETFLGIDRQLIATRDKRELEKLVKQVSGFNITQSSICTDNFIVTPTGPGHSPVARDISQIRRECNPELPDIKDGTIAFHCFRNAQGTARLSSGRILNCANPPAPEHRNPSACSGTAASAYASPDCNPLRVMHQVLASKPFCAEHFRDIREERHIPEEQDVQKLIFFDNFKANLKRHHSADLAKMEEMLKNLGSSARLSDLSQLSRAEILKRFAEIKAFLNGPGMGASNHPRASDISFLKEGMAQVEGMMGRLELAPSDWFEASGTKPSPTMQGIFSSSRRNDIDARTRMVQLEEGLRSRRTEIESSDTQRNQQIAEIDRRLAGNRDDSVGLELRKQRGDLLRARNRLVATRLLEEVRRRGPGDNSQAHELLIRKLTLESQRGF